MRILQISSARSYGDDERHLVDLSRELVKRRREVYVALRPTSEWRQKLDFLPEENFLQTSVRNSFGMFSSRSIARFIEEKKIDIVHAHVARDYLAASVAARSAGSVKFVLTYHNTAPLKPFLRFALSNVSAAISVGPAGRTQLERIFPAEKVVLIPNGIDVDRTAPTTAGSDLRSLHGIPRDVPLIVVSDELKLSNGQRDVVLAANEVIKSFPNCRFVISGNDATLDQRFRRELKRLVRVFGLDERFTWLNALDDPSPLIAAADILVSASHADNSRLTILMAMTAGKVVIATETDTTRELITDPHLLAPAKDPLALADRISESLADRDIRGRIGAELQAAVRERFGLDRMVDATDLLYQKISGA